MNLKLSPTMQAAVDLVKMSPTGKLFRWPGGFWLVVPQHGLEKYPAKSFMYAKTLTVEALVRRGVFIRDESSRDVYLTVVRLSDEEIQSANSDHPGVDVGRGDIPSDITAHARSLENISG